jgi:ubiquitin C-terminal hydrolase
MSIWTLPNILVVHLKRFQYTRWNRNKISSNVSFPLEKLDLKPWVENPDVLEEDCVYDLFGVSNHSGKSGFVFPFSQRLRYKKRVSSIFATLKNYFLHIFGERMRQ